MKDQIKARAERTRRQCENQINKSRAEKSKKENSAKKLKVKKSKLETGTYKISPNQLTIPFKS